MHKSFHCLIVHCVLLLSLCCPAVTRHYSFQPTQFQGGGGTSVVAPTIRPRGFVPTPATPTAQTAMPKPRTLKGKVINVVSGDEIWVVPLGGARSTVRLTRIEAPKKDDPHFKMSRAFLTCLIFGKTVEVRWQQKDGKGRIHGVVYLNQLASGGSIVDVNLTAVVNGMAKYVPGQKDDPKVFTEAEKSARATGRGIWNRNPPPGDVSEQ